MIWILSQQVGNSKAIIRMLRKSAIRFTTSIDDLSVPGKVKGIILPGNGAFDSFMSSLRENEVDKKLVSAVKQRSMPILGICVGMQAMFSRSDEGDLAGLGLFNENITLLDKEVHYSNIGWQRVHHISNNTDNNVLLSDRYFFSHSYALQSPVETKFEESLIATGREDFIAGFRRDHCIGVQFHPEKSGVAGFKLLNNFWAFCNDES